MTEAQANNKAAAKSKAEGAQYVVWVFDQGRDVYSREQVKMYGQFLTIEGLWVDGVYVASEMAVRLARM